MMDNSTRLKARLFDVTDQRDRLKEENRRLLMKLEQKDEDINYYRRQVSTRSEMLHSATKRVRVLESNESIIREEIREQVLDELVESLKKEGRKNASFVF